MGHTGVGWSGSYRGVVGPAGVGWVMQGWDGVDRAGVGWVMQGWGGVGHAGAGGSCRDGMGSHLSDCKIMNFCAINF